MAVNLNNWLTEAAQNPNWKYHGNTYGQPGVGAIGGAPTFQAWREATGNSDQGKWMQDVKNYYGQFAGGGGGGGGGGGALSGSADSAMNQYMSFLEQQQAREAEEAARRKAMYNRLTKILDSYELSDEEKLQVASRREQLRGRVIEDYKREFEQTLAAQTRTAEAEAAGRGISGGLARAGEQELQSKMLGQVSSMRAGLPLQVAEDVRQYEQDYRNMLGEKSKTALGMFQDTGNAAVNYAKNIGAGLGDVTRMYMDESQFARERADQQSYWADQMNMWRQEQKQAGKTNWWGIAGDVLKTGAKIIPWLL